MHEIVRSVVAQIPGIEVVNSIGTADLVVISRETQFSEPKDMKFRSDDSENVLVLGDNQNMLATPQGVTTVGGGLATFVELVENLSRKTNGHGQGHRRLSKSTNGAGPYRHN
jgi:hypothetical protein